MDKFDACVDAARHVRLELKFFDGPEDKSLRATVKRLVGSRAHLAYLRCRLDWTIETIIWKDPIACFASKAAMDRRAIPLLVTWDCVGHGAYPTSCKNAIKAHRSEALLFQSARTSPIAA